MQSLVNRLTNGYGKNVLRMQLMAGEDPRVEINTLAGKNVAPRKRRKAKQSESKGKP